MRSLAVSPSGSSGVRQQVGEERRPGGVLPGADAGVELRGADPEQRHDHQRDQAEHDPGGGGVRAVEAAVPADLLGLRAQPDDREGDDPEQHGDAEEVLQEAQRPALADQRDVEVDVEDGAVRLDDREREDEEAPEHEEVRQARDAPLQQPLLAEDLGDLTDEPPRPADEPARRGLAGGDHAEEEEDPPTRDRQRHDGDQQPADQPHEHVGLHSTSWTGRRARRSSRSVRPAPRSVTGRLHAPCTVSPAQMRAATRPASRPAPGPAGPPRRGRASAVRRAAARRRRPARGRAGSGVRPGRAAS